jgi:hypothetical protein
MTEITSVSSGATVYIDNISLSYVQKIGLKRRAHLENLSKLKSLPPF